MKRQHAPRCKSCASRSFWPWLYAHLKQGARDRLGVPVRSFFRRDLATVVFGAGETGLGLWIIVIAGTTGYLAGHVLASTGLVWLDEVGLVSIHSQLRPWLWLVLPEKGIRLLVPHDWYSSAFCFLLASMAVWLSWSITYGLYEIGFWLILDGRAQVRRAQLGSTRVRPSQRYHRTQIWSYLQGHASEVAYQPGKTLLPPETKRALKCEVQLRRGRRALDKHAPKVLVRRAQLPVAHLWGAIFEGRELQKRRN